jgi:hypothetical protein
MPAKTVAIVVLALALLGACSSGDDDGGAVADESTTTTEALDLDAALLTPEDLATGDALDAGWVVGDVSAGVEIDLPDCLLETPSGGTHAEAKLVTNNDLKLPSFEEDLSAYEGDGAADAFTAAATRLDGCAPEFVFQGTPSTGAIERLPLTIAADQSAAWNTTVSIAGVDVSITTIHVVAGDHELSFVHVNTGPPDATVLEGYVSKALAKLG